MMNKMEITVIHYTKDPDFKLRKIEIENCPMFPRVKPRGGMWTSPVKSKFGWDKWCECEHYGCIDKSTKVEMVIDVGENDENKNLIVIDGKKDLDKLIWTSDPVIKELVKKIGFMMEFIDFEKMKENNRCDLVD